VQTRWMNIFTTVVIVLIGLSCYCSAETLSGIQLEPNLISIGAFYNGARASLSGEIPGDAEVLIRVSKEAEDIDFFRKGRVWGLFWMNVGKITFHNLPGVYMLYLSENISESLIAHEPELRRMGIGFDALTHNASITPDNSDKDARFREFIELKKSDGQYAVHENALVYHLSEPNAATKSFACDLTIPPAMPQGIYEVTTFVFKNGGVYLTDTRTLKIEETGLPAKIVSLAFGHGTAYGILSVLIAITAGLLMGIIFKSDKSSH
jgi:uncharacterized protein (TIGR02186 family)